MGGTTFGAGGLAFGCGAVIGFVTSFIGMLRLGLLDFGVGRCNDRY